MNIKRLFLLLIILCPLVLTGAYVVTPTTPMGPSTPAYEKHFRMSAAFPFLIKYHLLKPEYYDPSRSYPLVLVLHGANKTAYPGYVLGLAEMRAKHPAFVVAPIAPLKSYWASPFPEAKMGGMFPAINHALRVMDSVKTQYNIDQSQVYVTGNSMGGFGTFAAVARRPGTFAAAVSVCGGWDAYNVSAIADSGTPIRAYHGANDNMIPAHYSRDVVSAIKKARGRAEYIEIPDAGHACHMNAYKSLDLWDWMFEQKLR